MVEFPFIEFDTRAFGTIVKPFAFVELQYADKSVPRYPLLIDSGADITVLPKSTGLDLDLPAPTPEETQTISGLSGGIPVVYRQINITIGENRFPCRIAWAQVEEIPPVLGQLDVFDAFDVEFKRRERKILFKL